MLVFVAMDALYGELVSPRATFTRVTRVVHMPIMYSIHGHPSAHTFSVLMKYLIFGSVLAVVTSESFCQKNVKNFGAVHIMMICVSVSLQCSMAIKLKLVGFEMRMVMTKTEKIPNFKSARRDNRDDKDCIAL